jgi:hypothetical protein
MRHRWCRECAKKITPRMGVEAQRAKWLQHRVMIEAMWADGLTHRQIQAAARVPTFNSGAYRRMGYDLPHRYPVRGGA